MDDSGTARLATAGRSSVVAVSGTSVADHLQSELNENINDHRFVAPEIQWPEEHDPGRTDKILVTKESDVYGIGMVVYTVCFHCLVSSGPRVKSHVDLLPGLDG